MDPTSLIPTPDAIPAPSWVFIVLNVLTFLLHILLMNVVLGGSLIILFSRFKKSATDLETSLSGSVVGKLPTSFALTINLGVAPLLFLQILYGHFFYSSSVLLAIYWILIIPLLILAYYGAYIHQRKYASTALSMAALLITSVILLYIAFIFVNNMTLMIHPDKWNAYFANRGGTILNWGDPTLIPRYLHFVTAAIAVAGLFMALVWWMRGKKNASGAQEKVKTGLKIFGIATAVQIVFGFWFLIALPQNIMLQFMGQNILATIILFAGVLFGIGAMILAFLNKFTLAVIHLLVTVVLMVISRAFLRSMYLADIFSLKSLNLSPQYGVMVLFLAVFVIGLIVVGYMVKIGVSSKEGRVTS